MQTAVMRCAVLFKSQTVTQSCEYAIERNSIHSEGAILTERENYGGEPDVNFTALTERELKPAKHNVPK